MKKINDWKYFIIALLIFFIFVYLLYYSYLHKLGYLPKATYLIFPLLIFFVLLNLLKNLNQKIAGLFWFTMLIIFFYGLIDKIFHIHIIIGKHYFSASNLSSSAMVQGFSIISFAFVMLIFNKYLTSEYKRNPDWLYVFFFAYSLSIVALITDFLVHNRIEDYFELFSLYFFAASFLLALILHNKIKNENRNISSTH